jgi:hypothetical protein
LQNISFKRWCKITAVSTIFLQSHYKMWKQNSICRIEQVWAGYLRQYSNWLWAGRSRNRILVGARFSAHPDRPWDPPSLLCKGYQVFLEGSAAGACCWLLTPF